MRLGALSFVLSVASLLNACAQAPVQSQASPPRPLAAPATLQTDRVAQQIVRGAFGEREMTMNCIVSVRGDLLTVIGLTALGARVFTIRYDGSQVQVEKELPTPPQLTAERLLADIQLAFWPSAALQPVLAQQGWRLTEPFPRTRRLWRGSALVGEVHYDDDDPWRGRSWLVNLQHGYTLGIESRAPDAQ